jgi:hypothetical protein
VDWLNVEALSSSPCIAKTRRKESKGRKEGRKKGGWQIIGLVCAVTSLQLPLKSFIFFGGGGLCKC